MFRLSQIISTIITIGNLVILILLINTYHLQKNTQRIIEQTIQLQQQKMSLQSIPPFLPEKSFNNSTDAEEFVDKDGNTQIKNYLFKTPDRKNSCNIFLLKENFEDIIDVSLDEPKTSPFIYNQYVWYLQGNRIYLCLGENSSDILNYQMRFTIESKIK